MLFHLEILKSGSFSNLDPFIQKHGLVDSLKYELHQIRLRVFSYLKKRDVTLIEDEKKLLFVHGNSKNVTLSNYTNTETLFGNFNLVAINKQSQKVEFVKDFTNSFDSFYYQDKQRLIISNNPLWIKPALLTINYQSVAQYLLLTQGFFPDNYFFNEIHKINPGSIYVIKNGNSELTIKKPKIRESSFESFFDGFRTIVDNGIKNGHSIDLTGGYDSRLVTATALYLKKDVEFAVHGENDPEVKFVKKLARKINVPLKTIEINNKIDGALKNWDTYFFLSGGYYNLFETIKEGARSLKRSKFVSSKVGGSMGEVIRDTWYVDKLFRRNLLKTNPLWNILSKRLFNSNVAYNFCTKDFCQVLDTYKEESRVAITNEIETFTNYDSTQKYMRILFEKYTRGWNGTLYNFHNNIIELVAPYMDNQFYIQCLNVNAGFRNYSKGITNAINTFYPPFKKIPFIDGQACKPVKGANFFRYLFFNYKQEFSNRILKKTQKKDYRHSYWLENLLKMDDFSSRIYSENDIFNSIISKIQFEELIQKGLKNKLSGKEYVFLWKLISMKISLSFEKSIK